MAQVNRKKLYKKRWRKMLYFFFKVKSVSVFVTLVLLIGVLLAAYFTKGNNLAVHVILGSVSILAFLIFLLAILRAFNNKLTCAEMDVIIADSRKKAYDGLFVNFAVNNSKKEFIAEPIELTCPEVFPGRKTIVYRHFKKTGKVYYSQMGYTWLLFGPNRLFYYHASVNYIYDLLGYETATEVSYKDIVSVKTETTYRNNTEMVTLYLSLTNGEVIDIKLRTRPSKLYTSTHELNETEVKVLSTIRKIIRENK